MAHSTLQKLEKLDRRWVFLAMALAVAAPLFFKIGLAPKTTPPVKEFYDYIEALPPGSRVLCSFDYDPGSKAELDPMCISVLEHLMDKGHKPVVITLWSTAPALIERNVNLICRDKYGKQYGTDYVYLGLKEGREAVMVAMGKSIRATFPVDFYGTPVEQIPLMNGVENYEQFQALINVSAGYPGTKEYVQYVTTRFAIPLLSGASAVSVPEYSAYYQSGQLKGLLTGITGAAEYEALLGKPGLALIAMDGQTMGHFVIIAFILFGNIVYFFLRREKARG
ncbi:MAG: hypothetical protein IPP40_03010 [bacterium]|nr:hypothetical protein [bacterium]